MPKAGARSPTLRKQEHILKRVLVEDITWHFGYGLTAVENRFDGTPYLRQVHLTASGKITRGDQVGVSTVEMFVYSKDFDDKQSEPRPIGSGPKSGEHAEFVMSLPDRDLQLILSVAAGSRLAAISLTFHAFKRGKSLLQAASFDTKVAEDDW
jgi:hypothetical protein